MIYLDHAATTTMDEEALNVYSTVAKNYYGNASSLHDIGGAAEEILQQSRTYIADHYELDESSIIFTSGGTESNRLALSLLSSLLPKDRGEILVNETEHPSIFRSMPPGVKDSVTTLPLPHKKAFQLLDVIPFIRSSTGMVVMQHVNAEIGIVHDIARIGRYCAENDILIHCDCVQSFGKLSLDTILANVSSISISAHKIGGPKGVGALLLSPSVLHRLPIQPKQQELGLRYGTENIPGIASFVTAIDRYQKKKVPQEELWRKRALFIDNVREHISSFIVLEERKERQLANIIACTIPNVEGQWMMLEANRLGLCMSTGSACQVGMQAISPSIRSFAATYEEQIGYFRVSFAPTTTEEELVRAARIVVTIYEDWQKKKLGSGRRNEEVVR